MNILIIYVLFLLPYVMHVCLVTLRSAPFCTDRVSFLEYVVTLQGNEVDESKIHAIMSWPTPLTVTQVRRFLGLAGFYQCFVWHFSTSSRADQERSVF
jgi:hypothetical protein